MERHIAISRTVLLAALARQQIMVHAADAAAPVEQTDRDAGAKDGRHHRRLGRAADGTRGEENRRRHRPARTISSASRSSGSTLSAAPSAIASLGMPNTTEVASSCATVMAP